MYQKITLPNGARLLTEAMPGFRSAALGFFVGVGSRYESAGENGASHFIEHMLFKGTQHRTAVELARDADAIGGQLNAYTTKTHTCFHIRALDSHLDRAMDLLEDMLFHSKFDPSDTEMEREVILKEIDMYEDNPEDLVNERLEQAVYRGSSLARPVLGTQATLAGMDGDWLRTWQKERYHAGVMVASLAGSFSQKQADRLRDLLASLPAGPLPEAEPAVYVPAVIVKKKDIEQNHLALAFPCPADHYERRAQVLLLNGLLGGGSSSRLFQELREKRGLCYSTYSYVADHNDAALMTVYTAVTPELEQQALETIRQVIGELAEHGPHQEEVDRVRELAKANVLMAQESVQARMSTLGLGTLLKDKVWLAEEMVERYEAVTREQLQQLAGEILQMGNAALSAVGQVGVSEDYAEWLGQ